MAANLSLRHDAVEQHFGSNLAVPEFRAFAGRIAAKVSSVFASLLEVLRPTSFEEAYLAESQNIAELERRMLELQSHHNRFSSSYW